MTDFNDPRFSREAFADLSDESYERYMELLREADPVIERHVTDRTGVTDIRNVWFAVYQEDPDEAEKLRLNMVERCSIRNFGVGVWGSVAELLAFNGAEDVARALGK